MENKEPFETKAGGVMSVVEFDKKVLVLASSYMVDSQPVTSFVMAKPNICVDGRLAVASTNYVISVNSRKVPAGLDLTDRSVFDEYFWFRIKLVNSSRKKTSMLAEGLKGLEEKLTDEMFRKVRGKIAADTAKVKEAAEVLASMGMRCAPTYVLYRNSESLALDAMRLEYVKEDGGSGTVSVGEVGGGYLFFVNMRLDSKSIQLADKDVGTVLRMAEEMDRAWRKTKEAIGGVKLDLARLDGSLWRQDDLDRWKEEEMFQFDADGLRGELSAKLDSAVMKEYCATPDGRQVPITLQELAELVGLRRRHIILKSRLEAL